MFVNTMSPMIYVKKYVCKHYVPNDICTYLKKKKKKRTDITLELMIANSFNKKRNNPAFVEE